MEKNRNRAPEEESPQEKSLRFVAAHYRRDAFSSDRDWLALNIDNRSWLRRHTAAAAIWGGILLASAAVATWMLVPADRPQPAPRPTPAETHTVAAPDLRRRTQRIEFADASLEEVADSIRSLYGVELTDMPVSGKYRLTLSYEGTADELVDVINDILGTSIRISEPDGKMGAEPTMTIQ